MARIDQILALLEQTPDDPFLRFAHAKELENCGLLTAALAAWSWFPENAPDYNGFYYHYGQLLAKENQQDKAIFILKQGLDKTKEQGDRHAYSELRSLLDEVVE
ncbi:MAG: hypothetical protein KA479_02820 [Saprospiraceae bacterium]|jgi:tetratricopeptide (TPR) repeat protein|nr:hypothetical protein [Saprospiraceae bacterium]